MPYKENLKKAVELKKELDTFRPLSKEVEQRIMQKFRLDWNYHSSNIEGNKLTYGETKALILFGTTAKGKPLHDHLEMKGHNEAIKWLEDIVKDDVPVSETMIRELHTLIMNEDGSSIKIGQYKTTANHVITLTGETFYFASPEETPAKMNELVNWYRQEVEKEDVNPVLLAIEFHYRFIRIHPFDDGNGRMARLLMNFILMKHGYPPAIVKTEDKENYFVALRQADAGDIAYFFDYVTSLVNHSLELMIKGAKGESIEEEDDLDKQLALLKQEIEAEDEEDEIKEQLTDTVLWNCMENWGDKLLFKLAETAVKFNHFYTKPEHRISFMIERKGRSNTFADSITLEKIKQIESRAKTNKSLSEAEVSFSASFGPYKKGGLEPFECNYRIEIKFEQYHYTIFTPLVVVQDVNGNWTPDKQEIKKLLHQPLTETEINAINKTWGETLLQHLNTNRAKLKNGK